MRGKEGEREKGKKTSCRQGCMVEGREVTAIAYYRSDQGIDYVSLNLERTFQRMPKG